MSGSTTLVVLNYAVDSRHPIFSHQSEVVRRLAHNFDRVIVITGEYSKDECLPDNVNVFSTNWVAGTRISSAVRFLRIFYAATKDLGPYVIFSHMTEVQSFLIAPWVWIKSKSHFLWYAHKSKSKYLLLCYPFLSGVISSTQGSCPLHGRKVHFVGQGVDEKIFLRKDPAYSPPKNGIRGITVGRLDPSKRVEEIVLSSIAGTSKERFLNLTLIGAPSKGYASYNEELRQEFAQLISSSRLFFKGSMERKSLPFLMQNSDVFLHAFRGSLDKTLIEATIFGLPVITSNIEYISIFGSWSDSQHSNINLTMEVRAFLERPIRDIEAEINRRQHIALSNHSLTQWIEQVIKLIKAEI